MNETRKCAVCSRRYIATRANKKYCSSECFDIGEKRAAKKRYSKQESKKAIAKKKKEEQRQAIVNVAAEAKKHGLSYGQYVAKMEQEKIKGGKDKSKPHMN